MIALQKLGRLFKISDVVRNFQKFSSKSPQIFDRRNENLYQKSIEECRRAGEIMRKIADFSPRQKYSDHSFWKRLTHDSAVVTGRRSDSVISDKIFGEVSSCWVYKCDSDKCDKNESKKSGKDDPCSCPPKKEDCNKKKDPPKKEEHSKKKKEDPCKKIKDDPCKKDKEDPCKKKKEDPCKKKKEEPCKKKKEDPCTKKKEDPCKKKKEDPGKKKDDPCKKKEDTCKKEDSSRKKKEDPCNKNNKGKSCASNNTSNLKKPVQSLAKVTTKTKQNEKKKIPEKKEIDFPEILEQVDVIDKEKAAAVKSLGKAYKNKEYLSYKNTAFYDLNLYLSSQRSHQKAAKDKGKNGQKNENDQKKEKH